jgi:hypothetical protein
MIDVPAVPPAPTFAMHMIATGLTMGRTDMEML